MIIQPRAPQQASPDTRPKWFNSPISFYGGTLSDIGFYLPDFERRSFALRQPDDERTRINERLDTIVRKPTMDDPNFVPVGVVSKEYVLVPHTEVLTIAAKAILAAHIPPTEVGAELKITEYGERMALSLYLPERYSFDPGDGHSLALRLECFNSVEGSTRFRALMGWFRFVCSNGLIIGVTRSDLRRRHIGDLSLSDVEAVLISGIEESDKEKKNFEQWRKREIQPSKLTSWIKEELRKGWGFKAAADLVLTAPGLSVIVRAVEEARRIFERMNSYAIYRIVETIRIMFFVVLAMIFFNFYPITAIMIILLALFNDVPIMAIAFDRTLVEPNPVRWNMRRVLTLSTVLGLTGVLGSFLMLIIAKNWLKLDIPQIQTFVFLKMAVAGHLTLFVTRTPRMFLRKPHPAPILFWSAVITKLLATLFVVYPFGLITPIHWRAVGVIWTYCLVWLFMGDLAKLAVLRHLEMTSRRHQTFLRVLKHCTHPFCSVEKDSSGATPSGGR